MLGKKKNKKEERKDITTTGRLSVDLNKKIIFDIRESLFDIRLFLILENHLLI